MLFINKIISATAVPMTATATSITTTGDTTAAVSIQCCTGVFTETTATRTTRRFHTELEQVAQLSQRDRAAGLVSYGQKWKTGTGRLYLRTL